MGRHEEMDEETMKWTGWMEGKGNNNDGKRWKRKESTGRGW